MKIRMFFKIPSKLLFVRLGLIAILLVGILMPISGRGDELTDCMMEMMPQADDKMTIGELRLQCQEKIQQGTLAEENKPAAVLSERLRQDEKNILQPLTLMSHKPNYILLGAYNSNG